MPKGNKNQRHKQKLETKKSATRRRESVAPLKRLVDSPGSIECWMTDGFQDCGQMQVFVRKQAGSLSGIACFLIDQGVVGLKDAWTRMNVSRSEFDALLVRCDLQGLPVFRIEPTDVAEAVAGGLRWASDNGMRLPKDWAEAASLVGGVGAWESADVSLFKKEFVGHPEDLRQRLISEPFETYIQRSDIEFDFDTDASYKDQETGMYLNIDEEVLEAEFGPEFFKNMPLDKMEEMAAAFTPVALALAGETVTWLAVRKETPSSEIFEAWRSTMIAAVMSKSAMPEGTDDEVFSFGQTLLGKLEERIEEASRADYHAAVDQVLEYLNSDPEMVQRAMVKHGLDDDSLS